MKGFLVLLLFITTASFAQKTDSYLNIEADTIQKETVAKANTTVRVGRMLKNIIGSKASLLASYNNPSFINSLNWNKITNAPTTLSGFGITDPVLLASGSYVDPVWLTSLSWNKISGVPTTLVDFGITDPVVVTTGSYADPAWITSLDPSKVAGTVFTSDITFVLSGGKSFGKYINGQTATWTGLTAVQALMDAAKEYINPTFTSFTIPGQSTTVEVGTTLSGTKIFSWGVAVNSGIVPTIDVYDNTGAVTLIAGTTNDGSQAANISTVQLNSNGASQSWKGIGNNTSPIGIFISGNFLVTSRYLRFYGAASTSVTNSAGVRALVVNAFHTGATVFNLATGNTLTKFIVALPPGVTISTVIDLDALNADITSQYILTGAINVLDAGSTNRVYNIYEMNVGVAYSVSHRHAITTN